MSATLAFTCGWFVQGELVRFGAATVGQLTVAVQNDGQVIRDCLCYAKGCIQDWSLAIPANHAVLANRNANGKVRWSSFESNLTLAMSTCGSESDTMVASDDVACSSSGSGRSSVFTAGLRGKLVSSILRAHFAQPTSKWPSFVRHPLRYDLHQTAAGTHASPIRVTHPKLKNRSVCGNSSFWTEVSVCLREPEGLHSVRGAHTCLSGAWRVSLPGVLAAPPADSTGSTSESLPCPAPQELQDPRLGATIS